MNKGRDLAALITSGVDRMDRARLVALKEENLKRLAQLRAILWEEGGSAERWMRQQAQQRGRLDQVINLRLAALRRRFTAQHDRETDAIARWFKRIAKATLEPDVYERILNEALTRVEVGDHFDAKDETLSRPVVGVRV